MAKHSFLYHPPANVLRCKIKYQPDDSNIPSPPLPRSRAAHNKALPPPQCLALAQARRNTMRPVGAMGADDESRPRVGDQTPSQALTLRPSSFSLPCARLHGTVLNCTQIPRACTGPHCKGPGHPLQHERYLPYRQSHARDGRFPRSIERACPDGPPRYETQRRSSQ